jgi:spoIIIJ-associated protein
MSEEIESVTESVVSEEVEAVEAEVVAEPADVETEDIEAPKPKEPQDLLEEADIAADYLEELLDIADIDGDIDTDQEVGRPLVSIVNTSDLLVGRDGEVLDALQELSRLAVLTETGHRSRLTLDIAGFRAKRRKELEQLAADACNEAQTSGEPVRLTPMNPYERKIVHDAVAAAGLVSESEGAEPNRRVVIQLATAE